MPDVTVPVPDDRLGEFYEWFGRWLVNAPQGSAGLSEDLTEWVDTQADLSKAQDIWRKLSPRAKALFSALLDAGGGPISGADLASRLGIPNGKYGVAGVLAWPGRHAAAASRPLPVRYEDGPPGGSANYWIPPIPAALFARARSADPAIASRTPSAPGDLSR